MVMMTLIRARLFCMSWGENENSRDKNEKKETGKKRRRTVTTLKMSNKEDETMDIRTGRELESLGKAANSRQLKGFSGATRTLYS
jgi:hypothetical protein